MVDRSASFAYLSSLIDGAEHDADALRNLEQTIPTPSDLAAAEAATLRARIWKPTARGSLALRL